MLTLINDFHSSVWYFLCFLTNHDSVRHYLVTVMQNVFCKIFFLFLARLPFKRLNPEPKENQPPKRPCTHACPGPNVSDGQDENESSPLSERSGPPLVNGRGPLDGFLSRRRPASSDENVVIDLTEDKTPSAVLCLVSPALASSCLSSKVKNQHKDKTASSGKPSSVDDIPKTHTVDSVVITDDEIEEVEEQDQTSVSQLDTTQDSDSESDEKNVSGNISSSGNKSMQSASSVSSMSESSPEKMETGDPSPITTPTVCTTPLVCVMLIIQYSKSINRYS